MDSFGARYGLVGALDIANWLSLEMQIDCATNTVATAFATVVQDASACEPAMSKTNRSIE